MSAYVPHTTGSYINFTLGENITADTSVTAMCWFNLSGNTAAQRQIFVFNTNIGIITATDGLTLNYDTPGGATTGSMLNINTWYHVAASINSTSSTGHSIRCYLNGNVDADFLDTSTFVTYTTGTVGNWVGTSLLGLNPYTYGLNGQVKDFRVWSGRALSQSEINDEMKYGYVRNPSGLCLWGQFDDNLNYDKSGNTQFIVGGSGITNQTGGLLQRIVY